MADQTKPAAPATPAAASQPAPGTAPGTQKPTAGGGESSTLGGGVTHQPTPPGTQQSPTEVRDAAAQAAGSDVGQGAVGGSNNAKAEGARKKYEEAKRNFDKAHEEYMKAQAVPETTSDEDKKSASQFASAQTAAAGGVQVHGRPGGAFSIEGTGFGSSGDLRIGGRTIPTTRWQDNSVKGQLPPDLEAGDVVLKTQSGSELKGKWPYVPQVATGQPATVAVTGQVVQQGSAAQPQTVSR